MKKLLLNIFFFSVAALLLSSCKKDETRAVMSQSTAPTLTASTVSPALLQANAASDAVTFTWGGSEYGFPAAVNYTLQLSRKGTNWAAASTTDINLSNNTSRKFTIGDLNRELLKFLPAGQANDVDVRVRAEISPSLAPVYSNVVTLRTTPYRDLITYEFPQALRIAGNHQGWTPGTAPKIVDRFASGTTGTGYEGYINFGNGGPEFKMVKGADWSAGDFGSAGTGKLGNGGGNLTLPSPGVYRIKANTQAMEWSYDKIDTWGIIGDATPGGWGGSTPLTMNADGTYSITTQLEGGKEMKFRANNAWDINFGDNKNNGPDNVPDYGGDNIAIPSTGTYQIILDLTIAGNYNYTIRKV
jgi:starch-binding outer membrane protein SusE/F